MLRKLLIMGALLAPMAVALPAEAAAKPCDVYKPPKAKGVSQIQKRGVKKAGKTTKVVYRATKYVAGEQDFPGWYKAIGPKKTRSLAPKALLCVPASGNVHQLVKTTPSGLRTWVNATGQTTHWRLRFDRKGRITVAWFQHVA